MVVATLASIRDDLRWLKLQVEFDGVGGLLDLFVGSTFRGMLAASMVKRGVHRMTVRIPIDEFKTRMSEVFERVWRDRETIEIEVECGKVVTLRPRAETSTVSEDDLDAFFSSFGAWSDIDAEQFLSDVYQSRDQTARKPIEL